MIRILLQDRVGYIIRLCLSNYNSKINLNFKVSLNSLVNFIGKII